MEAVAWPTEVEARADSLDSERWPWRGGLWVLSPELGLQTGMLPALCDGYGAVRDVRLEALWLRRRLGRCPAGDKGPSEMAERGFPNSGSADVRSEELSVRNE